MKTLRMYTRNGKEEIKEVLKAGKSIGLLKGKEEKREGKFFS